MRTAQRLMALFILFAHLSGCGIRREPMATEMGVPEDGSTLVELHYSLYFPDDGPFAFTSEIEAGQTVYLEESICTNTTEITVKNKGDISLTCDLYYPKDSSNVIQTFTLKPGKTMRFAGLTSSYVYAISFQSEESSTIDVRITG